MTRLVIILLSACFACTLRADPVPEANMKDVIYGPRPVYPFDARRRNLQGSGRFILHLRPDGTVARVDIEDSTGAPLLDRTAIDAYSKWRFKRGNAKSVAVTTHFTMRGYPYTPEYHPPRSP